MAASRRVQRTRRAWLVTGAILVLSALVALLIDRSSGRSRRPEGATGVTSDLARAVPGDAPRLSFREAAPEWGIQVTHGAPRRSSLLPEDMGPGLVLEDLDGDGDLDLFLVGFAGSVSAGDASTAALPDGGATHRLFRNDGSRFTDVTPGSGIDRADFGIGAAAGDVDRDGILDIYVTCYGRNRLFRGLGNLRYEEVGASAGVDDPGFGAGAAFGDADGDGDLDLYVCNYVEFRWDGKPPGASDWGGYSLPFTINPSAFRPAPNRYYRNRGDGTFEELAQAQGIDDPAGRSLGVSFADLSGDGKPDLYVLNDVSKNAYFENDGAGGFTDRSLDSLSADYRGAMGNAVGDLEGDGDLDLFITHWIAQENGFYLNLLVDPRRAADEGEALVFSDEADALGLGQLSLDYVGWGTAFADLDLDGAPDLVVVNGSTMESDDDRTRLDPQRPLLFWQRPGAGFFEIGAVCGAPWLERWNARGLADGDLDGDGDLDLVVAENHGPVHVLLNEGPPRGHWLRFRLRPGPDGRPVQGARVAVSAAGHTGMQELGAGTSYLTHRPLELTFGLGRATRATRVEVRWPDGREQAFDDLAADRILELSPGRPPREVERAPR